MIDLGAALDERLYNLQITPLCGKHQCGREFLSFWLVYGDASCQSVFDLFLVSDVCGKMKGKLNQF